MASDAFANFGCLDELTQVIYQSVFRFVALSAVEANKWTIHLGLAGSEGRWWKGSWTEVEIHQILGSKASDKLLDEFAESLAQLFIGGELYITNFTLVKGEKIKFTVGPASKTPVHIPLEEISSSEAAEYATTVFLEIALQAQSRKCRLNAPSVSYASPIPFEPKASTSRKPIEAEPILTSTLNVVRASSKVHPEGRDLRIKKSASPNLEVDSKEQAAQQEIKALKAELGKQKKRMTSPTEKPVPVARPHKGASLANPNKKARKYQAIEFASDDE